MKVSRRKFLGLSIGGALVAGGAYIIFRHSKSAGIRVLVDTKFLSDREKQIILTLIEDIFEAKETGMPLNYEALLKRMDDYVASLSKRHKRMYLGLFHIIEHGTLLTRYFPTPYTSLSKTARVNYLRGYLNSRFSLKRMLFSGLKMSLGMMVFSFPETNKFIEFNKECL